MTRRTGIRPIAGRFGLVGALTAIALVSGCSTVEPATPPGFDSEGVSTSAVTCADFAEFEDQYRESGEPAIVDPLTTYTADGANAWDSAADYFVVACKDVPADTTLYDLGASLFDLECADYLSLDPGIHAEWVAAWSDEYDVDFDGRSVPSVAALFEQECAALGDAASLWNVSLDVEDQLTLLLAHEWMDRDGYHYRFELVAASIDATSDVANALPDQAIVTVTWEITTRVTNLTPGRNAPYPIVSLAPIWESGSAACSGLEDWASSAPFAGDSAALCTISNYPISLATNIEMGQSIPEGETVEATFESSRLPAKLTVLEANLSSAVAALKSPAMWAMGLESSDQRRACLLANDIWLVAATGDTGCPLLPEGG